jgi:hypothetical protein
MKDKKAIGDDNVPGDVLRLLVEDCLKIMTHLIKNMYKIGGWPKDFIEITVISLKKKPNAAKCIDHYTMNFLTHTAKSVVRMLRTVERNIEYIFADHLGFRRGRGTRDAIGMLRMMSEQTLEID